MGIIFAPLLIGVKKLLKALEVGFGEMVHETCSIEMPLNYEFVLCKEWISMSIKYKNTKKSKVLSTCSSVGKAVDQ